MLRNTLFLMVLVGIFILQDCDSIDKLTQFEMDYEQTVMVPSSTGLGLPFNVQTPNVQSNSQSTFESNNTTKDLIEEIMLTDLIMTVTAPSDGSFDFMKSVEIFISADGTSETRIAWKDNIPAEPGSQLELDTTGDDLKEYIKKDKFNIRMSTVTDETISNDHEIRIQSVFFVDAEIIGQ